MSFRIIINLWCRYRPWIYWEWYQSKKGVQLRTSMLPRYVIGSSKTSSKGSRTWILLFFNGMIPSYHFNFLFLSRVFYRILCWSIKKGLGWVLDIYFLIFLRVRKLLLKWMLILRAASVSQSVLSPLFGGFSPLHKGWECNATYLDLQ